MTSTQKSRLLSEAINESGNHLVTTRKHTSAAAVVFVQAHGMDMQIGDKVSRETIEAAKEYNGCVANEEHALRMYRQAIQSFIDAAEDQLEPKGDPWGGVCNFGDAPTLN